MPEHDKQKVNAVASLNEQLKKDYSPIRLLSLLAVFGLTSGFFLKLLDEQINFKSHGIIVTLALAMGIPLLMISLIGGLRKLGWDGWLKRKQ